MIVFDPIQTGQRILELRRSRDVSVERIIEACGLSGPRSFYGWTSGSTRPSYDSLYALCCVFDVTLDELLVFTVVE